MTRKHKPQTAQKKRPAEKLTKPVKAVVAEKAVAAVANLREKERGKGAPALKKGAPAPRPAGLNAKGGTAAEVRPAGGKHLADKRPLGIERRVPAMPEDRQSQLKLLIARGKEQGYLTYAQVNDHLPSEIVDPEQIEDIVNTINDMGIPVYEKAPDTESLLATEPSQPADEEAIEEAAAALAALDAELGRTTDPVRMYMREMGTVELLTREGEIRIAKRIEEGLDAVRTALGKYPATFEHLLRTYELVKAGQARLIDLVVGFIDPNAPDVIAQPQNPTKIDLEADSEEKEEDAEEGDESEEEAIDTGPDPEEVARRMASIGKLLQQALTAIAKQGAEDPKTQKIRKKLSGEFMELKLSPRMFDALTDQLRSHISEIRQIEKEVMIIAVRDAGMPRKDFIATFPKNETSPR